MPSAIRPYEPSDLEELLEAWYQAARIAHSFLDEEFFARERRLIADEFLPVSEVTVAVVDGEVVGFVSLVGNEVGGIFVHPDHQGGGHGRALMAHARSTRPFIELDVFEANPTGRRFYDAYGFREIGRHDDEATGHPSIRLRLD